MALNPKITVSTQKVEQEVYTCSDGTTHIFQSSAENHQKYIDDAEIRRSLIHRKFSHPSKINLLVDWSLVENERISNYFYDEIRKHGEYFPFNGSGIGNKNTIKIGSWIYISYNPDCEIGERDFSDGSWTLDYMLSKYKEAIEWIETETANGFC